MGISITNKKSPTHLLVRPLGFPIFLR
uniref:Uncharacterized protein MANES_04G001300 n=1 Tax=Rhizophora mucronata TaxID=61149 RepID=A0A2P2R2M7_RHIMU